MIRHIVLIKFRRTVSEVEIAKSLDRIRSLRSIVPGILSIAAGKSESPEKIERGFMHGFVADFSDWDALARYQVHPEHKSAGAELVRLAEGGLDGILVFDLSVNESSGASPSDSVS